MGDDSLDAKIKQGLTLITQYVNVSQGPGIDREHPRGRPGPPDGRIAGSRGWSKKRPGFLGIRPFKKIHAYILKFQKLQTNVWGQCSARALEMPRWWE